MARIARLLWYWLPVLAWMALIFSLSGRSDFRTAAPAPVAESHEVFFAVSKLAHVVEYGILGLLLVRALTSANGGVRASLGLAVAVTVLLSGLFGAFDELRQSFVPNRSPRLADIALDTASALAASLVAAGWLHLRRLPQPLETHTARTEDALTPRPPPLRGANIGCATGKGPRGRAALRADVPVRGREGDFRQVADFSPSPTVGRGGRGVRACLRALHLLLLAIASVLLAACNTGAYPLDIFPEMHYQPSHRALEPQRLTPPDGAVPVTGAPPTITYAQADVLANPIPRTEQSRERAREVYRVNCATCHGATGDGQGPMAPYFAQSPAGVVPPTNLAAPRVQTRTDGQLWWIIGQGLGNMPPYKSLLADDEIWLTVQFIREVQGR